MATTTPNVYDLESDTARRLAERSRPDSPVLTLYLDLTPSEFATAQARATAIRSLLDDAARQLGSADLPHDQQTGLRESLDLVHRYLEPVADLPANGARALAVFCSTGADLFDVVKLPRPVPSRAVVEESPYVEPLVGAATVGDWCVLLVNRKVGRILRGTAERMEEIATVRSDTHGQHDQGGWSQARYERSVDKEAADHLRRVLDALFRRFRLRRFDHLLVGCPQELCSDVEQHLHPYLRERLAGRIEIDVENTTAADVRDAVAPKISEHERRREGEAIERMLQGVGQGDSGRGAGGLEDVLEALDQRRVELLLMEDGFAAGGVCCPQCGWLGPAGRATCPADGTETRSYEDVSEKMVEAALEQSADVVLVRHHDDLDRFGGVGAVLRF